MQRFKFKLHWQILLALILAVLFGVYFKEYIGYVEWMGTVFLRALKMIIVPLILSSVVSGVANLGGAENLGRLGLKTIGYYLMTTTLALLVGLVFVNILKPGVGADINLAAEVDLDITPDTLGNTLINIIPDNLFSSFSDNSQMLSVIFFSILFGFFITRVKDKYQRPLKDFFNAVFEVMMKVTMFIIKFTPFGIFGLVASKIAAQDDLGALMSSMGLYMITVLAALFVHAFITLPLIVRIIGKSKPYKHFRAMQTPVITAFSTSSSGATLPLTMDAVENKAGVPKKISSFTLPLGATINMDGTALYECVAAIFIAQAYGMDLDILQQILVVITGLLASIGAAAVPMAGLVMISIILSVVGLPLEGIGLILAVDRILDMFRTATNVWSDTCGAVVIAKSEKENVNY
ncbi:MAG: dicarboxylate/amino acid:cation symporter [Bacteroidota bacterium]|nr:dicarboxylate/amino acid:cation symporter [Bacteroidota bacterium]